MEVREGSSGNRGYGEYRGYNRRVSQRRRKRRRQRQLLIICAGFLLVLAVCGGIWGVRSHMRTGRLLEHRSAGIALMAAQDWDGAIAEFDTALDGSSRIGERELDVLGYRAEAEYRQGDYDAALHTYELLLEEDSDEATVDLYREMTCACLLESGRYEEALELHLMDGQVYNRVAVEKMNEGDYEGALADLEQGIAAGQEETMPSLLYNQAVAYEYLGKFGRALELFEQYVSRYGSTEELEREIAFLKTR